MIEAEKKWWKNSIVYQIYPRSFCDSNGDGIGDILGIISKLPYLKELGIDVIWLSPVYPSPNCDMGYDISDYKGIHPDFGTMDDMDELIKGAKALGIRIIMDLVINHTSDEHEWFKKALEGDSKYRDYYYFRPGKDGNKPNNWGSFFGSDVWEPVPGEENMFYLHLFDKKQPDLNWHNPEVYREVCDIMRFWLDKGIAGFRCDVINIIWKNSLEDGKKQLALTGLEHYLSTEGNHEILRRLRKEVLSGYDCFTVGETVMVDTKMATDLCGKDRGELDLVFGFEHMECDQIAVKWFKKRYRPVNLIKAVDKWQREVEWPTNYLENHDQPRSVNRFGDVLHFHKESAKMLCGLNLSLRGTPFIYEGEEIGMTNGEFDNLSEIVDVESHTIDNTMQALHFPARLRWKLIKQTTRDNARTPMQWCGEDEDGGKNPGAGFTTGKPWLKINRNHNWINVSDEERDLTSILQFYKDMIKLRHQSEALQWGGYKKLPSDPSVYAFERASDSEKVLVVCNMTGKSKKMPAGVMPQAEVLISNYTDADRLSALSGGTSSEASSRVLRPFEFLIFRSL